MMNLIALSVFLFFLPTNVLCDNWAILIAGSNYFFNYRHQSDVCHAYQIVTKSGKIPKSNIIVMMYDDIAHNSQNPFPGQLFNKPNGTNVYDGVEIDYKGNAVNKTTFLKVLKGDKSAGGRVLESTSQDDVFIYYADHGAVGLVAMPVGDVLYANELMDALRFMHDNSMYRQLVFYMEACESGSMFDGLLPSNMSIFATTAANPDESSYAFYYWDPVGTYLGDEYSIRWMEDSDAKWNTHESLETQFLSVQKEVKLSHPQQYGSKSFDNEPIDDFQGDETPAPTQIPLTFSNILLNTVQSSDVSMKTAIDSRDAKLAFYMKKYEKSSTVALKKYYKQLVNDEILNRATVYNNFRTLVSKVTGVDSAADLDKLMEEYRPPRNFDCLQSAKNLYDKRCGKLQDYGLKFVKNLVYLCEEYDTKIVISGVLDLC